MHCAIGIAFGEVTYGNVGSRERLDFTVIGHAANIAARLGDYGKVIGQEIVATAEVALEAGLPSIPLRIGRPAQCRRACGSACGYDVG